MIFLRSFLLDLKKLTDQKMKERVKIFFEELEMAESLDSVKNIKRLKGFTTAYRWPCGDYRLGFYLHDKQIELARMVKRNDIYKVFP